MPYGRATENFNSTHSLLANNNKTTVYLRTHLRTYLLTYLLTYALTYYIDDVHTQTDTIQGHITNKRVSYSKCQVSVHQFWSERAGVDCTSRSCDFVLNLIEIVRGGPFSMVVQ